MKVSKQEAAALQIDHAIQCLFDGSFVPAITIAAAAEDSMPGTERPNEVLIDRIRAHGPSRTGLLGKELIAHFNQIRNWLKHHKPDQIDLDIQKDDAVIMIVRAYTKFTSVFGKDTTTPSMEAFEAWFRENYRNWLGPEDEADRIRAEGR